MGKLYLLRTLFCGGVFLMLYVVTQANQALGEDHLLKYDCDTWYHGFMVINLSQKKVYFLDEVTIFTPNDTSWIENNNSLSYNFTMDSFGWINCDFFYNSTTPLTGVNVILPEKHNGSNTYVFIYYSDINSVANMDDYNFDSNFDLGTGYSTPVGLDVTFVTISEVNDTFYYDLTNTAIIDNHVEEIDELTIASESQIQNILNNLP